MIKRQAKKQVIKSLHELQLSAEQSEALGKMIQEAVNGKYRIAAEQDFIKDIAERAKEELELPPKFFNQLVNVAYRDNADKINEETTALLDLAEQIGLYEHNKD